MSERSRQYAVEAVVIILGSIAAAGLCASTTSDLQALTMFEVSSSLVVPGMAVIGALMTLAINDAMRSAVALLIVSALGSIIFSLSLAAPAWQLDGTRVSLIDRATTFGLLALLLISLFGLLGMVVVWTFNTVFRPGKL